VNEYAVRSAPVVPEGGGFAAASVCSAIVYAPVSEEVIVAPSAAVAAPGKLTAVVAGMRKPENVPLYTHTDVQAHVPNDHPLAPSNVPPRMSTVKSGAVEVNVPVVVAPDSVTLREPSAASVHEVGPLKVPGPVGFSVTLQYLTGEPEYAYVICQNPLISPVAFAAGVAA
jgi:hypothetical protein